MFPSTAPRFPPNASRPSQGKSRAKGRVRWFWLPRIFRVSRRCRRSRCCPKTSSVASPRRVAKAIAGVGLQAKTSPTFCSPRGRRVPPRALRSPQRALTTSALGTWSSPVWRTKAVPWAPFGSIRRLSPSTCRSLRWPVPSRAGDPSTPLPPQRKAPLHPR